MKKPKPHGTNLQRDPGALGFTAAHSLKIPGERRSQPKPQPLRPLYLSIPALTFFNMDVLDGPRPTRTYNVL